MDLAGKRVTVMGLGRFGGGVGVARYLVKQGADVLVTDLLSEDELSESLAILEGLPIEYRLGEHNVSQFTTSDLVVANPAVKPDNRFLRAAQAASIPITSEIRLLVAALPNRLRTIGVTGTAGKSTTTAMIGHILEKVEKNDRHHVWVGGNIGGSLLENVDQIGDDEWVVLELSSFMLHGLREDRWSPHIAVVTNIDANHLDWHGTFTAYLADKQVILDYQDSDEDAAVLGPELSDFVKAHADRVIVREKEGLDEIAPRNIVLPGFHNRSNATLAVDVAELTGVARAEAETALADFTGLPHRLQFVLEHNGVRYYNDSKCTTPEAAEIAIESFDIGTVQIILGGYDKGSELVGVAAHSAMRCAGVYTIGDTGKNIQEIAESIIARKVRPCEAKVILGCGELDTAVREAVKRAQPGQVVLLSPGCASWDQFDNYEQRGERFIELVKQLTGA